jgi:hypothetical protein
VWAVRYPADLAGQLGVYGNRGALLSPGFLPDNILSEPSRFQHLIAHWPPALDISGPTLTDTPLSAWLLVLGILPATIYVAWRARDPKAVGHRLVVLSLVGLGGLLLLLDQTKTPLYASVLLPSVCLCLAAACVGAVSASKSMRRATRLAIVGALGLLGVVLALESVHAYTVDWTEAATVTPYLPLGALVAEPVPPGALVLGPERWWWALHDRPYVSLRNIWFQWTALAHAGQQPEFADWMVRLHPASIIVNINVRDDVLAFPPALQAQFWEYMQRCTTLAADIPNPNYFETEVYAVTDACR